MGTYSIYRNGIKKGYFQFHDGKIPPKRCMGWIVLTEKGAEIYTELLKEHQSKWDYAIESYKIRNPITSQYQLAGGLTA